MSDIFVSYASQDRPRIRPLVDALQESGWSVFWDRSIPAGKTWRQIVGGELRSARAVVVAWTETSTNSEWVLEEAEAGKTQRILIPILLDAVSPPFGFGSIQAANLVDWNGDRSAPAFLGLIADIAALLGAPAPGGSRPADVARAHPPGRQSLRAEPPASATGTGTGTGKGAGAGAGTETPTRRWRYLAVASGAMALIVVLVVWMREPETGPAASEIARSAVAAFSAASNVPPRADVPALTPSTRLAVPAAPSTNDEAAQKAALTKTLGSVIQQWAASAAQSDGAAVPAGCDGFVFDANRGTLNGLPPSATQYDIKQALPCYTGETEEGSPYNSGGGVFFVNHDFYFYTHADLIEVRSRFAGRETVPLLRGTRDSVIRQLGSSYARARNGQAWRFAKPWGCLEVVFDSATAQSASVRQVEAHAHTCTRIAANE